MKTFKIMKNLIRLSLLLVLAFISSGCSWLGFGEEEIPSTHIVNMTITSRDDTNSGRLMYILVRNVTRKAFVSEKYDDVSKRVFADPPDSSVLVQKAIIPGKSLQLTFDDKRKDIAVYCFFSNPGKFWNTYIPFNPEKDSHYIELGDHQIQLVE
ncbi:MAG: hypothetical protein MK132_07330 [Lentisphaerales bacterium]|nr:hypothetical protein [Lentisphaerales bacterium]